MNKKYIIIALLLSLANVANAQDGIDEALRRVEQNNKTLDAARKLLQAERVEARTGNFLANPTADVEKLWTKNANAGYELTVKQSIDFPSAYARRNDLAHLRENTAARRYAASRQQVLLEAKQNCIEIVYRRELQALLDARLQNAERLAEAYRKKLEQGSANRLELNKILLETLDAREQVRDNQSALALALERLQALNGGLPVDFSPSTFPAAAPIPPLDRLQEQYLAADPLLGEAAGQEEIALQEVRLSRALSLPKFDVGYKRAASPGASASNGIVIGLSIPLFENKNKVASSRARASLAAAITGETRLALTSSLRQLHDRLLSLDAARNDYATVLADLRGMELLNKALAAGQLSVIDYFIELATFHTSRLRQLEIEKEYHLTLSQLLRQFM